MIHDCKDDSHFDNSPNKFAVVNTDYGVWEDCVYDLPDSVPAEEKDEMLIEGNSYRASVVRYESGELQVGDSIRREQCGIGVIVSYDITEEGTLIICNTIITEEISEEESSYCFSMLIQSFCNDVDSGDVERIQFVVPESLSVLTQSLRQGGFDVAFSKCEEYLDYDDKWSSHEFVCTYEFNNLE